MTPLVLVHGFMGGSAQWPGLAEALEGVAPVIAVDLPGFGANAAMDPLDRIEDFADWVIGQIDAPRYHLLGHSMGGMIAQEMALRDAARIDKLILYATGPRGVIPGRFETIAESKRRAEADGPEATATRIAATWFAEKEAAPGFPACARIARVAGLPAIHAGLTAMEAWSGEATLTDIPHDTLILWGDRDRTYTRPEIDLLLQGIPRAHLTIIPGCAHAVHLEAFDRVVPPLVAHLRDIAE